MQSQNKTKRASKIVLIFVYKFVVYYFEVLEVNFEKFERRGSPGEIPRGKSSGEVFGGRNSE